jgi:hypothetical protein
MTAAPHRQDTRAEELRGLGYAAYRTGDMARARQHFGRALALFRETHGEAHPETATGFSDLGAACTAEGDNEAARDCHEAALRIREAAFTRPNPHIAASLHNLGTVYRDLGLHEAAIARLTEARAMWVQMLGPDHAQVERTRRALAATLNNAGVAQRRRGAHAQALASFTAAVEAGPALHVARHNLAAALTRQGRHAEARTHRDHALTGQSVFVEPAPQPEHRVLILAGAEQGNVPLEHLLPEQSITRIWWFAGATLPDLPPYDLVFNALGDADLAETASPLHGAFLQACVKPVLNHPTHVAATRRDKLAGLLAGIPHCVVPPTVLVGTRADLPVPPFLLRPAGSHGGVSVQRIDTRAEAAGHVLDTANTWYATKFIDCRAADGYVRKYRIIFVGGVAYPYHLAISDNWLVHYFSADMPDHDWKLREEQQFLADWQSAIGAQATAAIHDIGKRLRLDYGGIDFSLLPDGTLLVFEANATMLVHPEDADGPLADKNRSFQTIIQAFGQMLRLRLS